MSIPIPKRAQAAINNGETVVVRCKVRGQAPTLWRIEDGKVRDILESTSGAVLRWYKKQWRKELKQ